MPKPSLEYYKKGVNKFNLDPKKSVLFEDICHNLKEAKFLGMKTVWLENDEPFASKDKDKPYIDYKFKGPLSSFLQKINILKAA
jgi:putative hydrolase of the HAD superfamily